MNKYEEGDSRGHPPYHLTLMVKLGYGYCTDRMSSRKLEQEEQYLKAVSLQVHNQQTKKIHTNNASPLRVQ